MTCDAVGCPVWVKFGFCGAHFRLVPKTIKDQLSQHQPGARLAAIKAVAAKEGKMKLFNELMMAEGR